MQLTTILSLTNSGNYHCNKLFWHVVCCVCYRNKIRYATTGNLNKTTHGTNQPSL